MITETIAAIATPPGAGGIGIIRISGSMAVEVVCTLFGKTPRGIDSHRTIRNVASSAEAEIANLSSASLHPYREVSVSASPLLESHRVTHGYIFDTLTGTVLDEVLVITMLAPRSYTAEDVVEIHAHSGPIVMQTILEQILSRGVRLAEPGEFTKRAFLNGRIDLTQAEAVADIINARSADALKIAVLQGLGQLRNSISRAREDLISLLALIEAAIDFPEETGDLMAENRAIEVIQNVLNIVNSAIQQYEDAHFLRDGLKISICGPPNVGKSSLMNRLLEKERSIVTDSPGTTRDLIEESLNINGVPFVISDTAGMHETDDPVEKIGIEKARQNLLESDMILFMEEARSIEDSTLTSIKMEMEAIVPVGKRVVILLNKVDLVEKEKISALPAEICGIPVIAISAKKDIAIDALRKKIGTIATDNLNLSSSVVPNLRHKGALKRVVESLEQARESLLNGLGEETLAIDIRSSIDYLGEITGDTAGVDILDHIFSRFCIGK